MKKSIFVLLASSIALISPLFADNEKGKDQNASETTQVEREKVVMKVSKMSCGSCSKKVSQELSKITGVDVVSVSFKNSQAEVEIPKGKVTREQLIEAVDKAGFPFEGELAVIPVKGMSCGACSKKVAGHLENFEGLKSVNVSHESGNAEVVFDPRTTSRSTLVAKINETPFKAE